MESPAVLTSIPGGGGREDQLGSTTDLDARRTKRRAVKAAKRLAAKLAREANRCGICGHTFCNRGNLLKHQRNVHKLQLAKGAGRSSGGKFAQTAQILDHYREAYGDSILKTESKVFKSTSEFVAWKEEVERNTAAKFVTRAGVARRQRDSFVFEHLQCHRSGVYNPRGENKRKLKTLGSNKIGSHCPAAMKIRTDTSTNLVTVDFVSTHVGHECELARLPLSKLEKDYLVEQMQQGLSKDRILASVASPFSPTDRLKLTKRKDLHNIAASFNIKHQNVHDGQEVDIVTGDDVPDEAGSCDRLLGLTPNSPNAKETDVVELQTIETEIFEPACDDAGHQLLGVQEILGLYLQSSDCELEEKRKQARSRLLVLIAKVDECTTTAELDSLIQDLTNAKNHLDDLKRTVTTIEIIQCQEDAAPTTAAANAVSNGRVSNNSKSNFFLIRNPVQASTNSVICNNAEAALETLLLSTTTD